jgi:NADH dehydrogenase
VKPPGPILVTGATGFIGRALVSHLIGAKQPVRALVRAPRQASMEKRPGLDVVIGDVLDRHSLRRAAEGICGVVHLAGVSSSADEETNRRVHVDGTRNLRDAVDPLGALWVVHVSSTCAARRLRDSYGETKRQGEGVWRGSAARVTVLRPTMVVGPGSAEWELFCAVVRRLPWVPIPGSGRTLLQPVMLPDLLDLIVRIGRDPGAPWGPFDVAGPEPIPVNDLVALVARHQGRRVRVLPIPPAVPILAARVLARVLAMPPWNVDQVLAFAQDTVVDIAPTRRTFGFDPRSLDEGLAEVFPPSA